VAESRSMSHTLFHLKRDALHPVYTLSFKAEEHV